MVDVNDRRKSGNPVTDWEEESERIQEKAQPPAPMTRLSDALEAAYAMANAGRPRNPLLTGFTDLDDKLRHLGGKEVTMLAADSGVGKSTIATQCALHVGECGHGVAYLNLEMSIEMYGIRTGANYTELSTQRAATGDLRHEELTKLALGLDRLKRAAKRVVLGNASEHRTIPAIKKFCADAKAELAKESAPLRLIVVDHVLQVMVNVRNDKDAEGKARADLLKELAETLNVHVLALVHVTRDASKAGKMPTKNELASSAWFDRHADNILVFHQRRTKDGTFEEGAKATLACQKARWGTPFRVELDYRNGFFYPWNLGQEDE